MMAALALLLGCLTLMSVCVGRYSTNPADVLQALYTRILQVPGDEAMENVVFSVRLPRVLAALLIGAALSVSGAVYQSAFRNPLVSPDLLGVSSGASTGAAVAIILGGGFGMVQGAAFLGGIIAVVLASSLPMLLRNASNMMLVLSGIIVSGLMTSLLGVVKFFAEEQTQLSSIVFWQMGSLSSIKGSNILTVAPPILICLVALLCVSWRLNILSFGEAEAQTVGVNVRRLRAIAIVASSLLTACSVSISGTIGWIGLVIPHFSRIIVGADNTRALPAAVLLGAMFLLVIDTCARTLTTMEIPLSILSGLVGAPFYAWLLYRQRTKIL